MNKKVKSMFVFTGTSMLSIGVLNFLSEASSKIKNFLTINKVIGPYSGKVIYGIILGIIIAVIYYYRTKESNLEIKNYLLFLVICLTLGCLLVFTPFLDLILK